MSDRMIQEQEFICTFTRNGRQCGDSFLNPKMLEKHQANCAYKPTNSVSVSTPTTPAVPTKETPMQNFPAKRITADRNDVTNPPPKEPEVEVKKPVVAKPALVPDPTPAAKPTKVTPTKKADLEAKKLEALEKDKAAAQEKVTKDAKAAEAQRLKEEKAYNLAAEKETARLKKEAEAKVQAAKEAEEKKQKQAQQDELRAQAKAAKDAEAKAKAEKAAQAKQDAPPAPEKVEPKANPAPVAVTPLGMEMQQTPPAPTETKEEEAARVAAGRQAALKKYNDKIAAMTDRQKTEDYLANTIGSLKLRLKLTDGWDKKFSNILGHVVTQLETANTNLQALPVDLKFTHKGQNAKGLAIGVKVTVKPDFRKTFALDEAQEKVMGTGGVIVKMAGEKKATRYWVKFEGQVVSNLESRHLDVLEEEGE